jgi:K+-sensing histidine kinase KdpD
MSQEQNIAKADIEYNLLSQITHDVRGPFNGLIGFSELLLKVQNAKDQEAYSLIVFQLANKSYLYLSVLIAWLKLISNNYKANTTVVSSESIINQGIKFNENEIEGKSIAVHSEVINKSVQADQVYMPLALGIILNLMIKFTKAGDEILIVSNEQNCSIQYIGSNEDLQASFKSINTSQVVYDEKTYGLWVAHQLISKQQFIHTPIIAINNNEISYSFSWA